MYYEWSQEERPRKSIIRERELSRLQSMRLLKIVNDGIEGDSFSTTPIVPNKGISTILRVATPTLVIHTSPPSAITSVFCQERIATTSTSPQHSVMSSNIKPLILHAHTTGPNPIKIAIALEKLKLPYEVKLWEFGDNSENGLKGAKFLAINENGRVPALEDPNTGVVSWESGAVMNYIRRKYDTENKLGPQGKSEQDIVDFEKCE